MWLENVQDSSSICKVLTVLKRACGGFLFSGNGEVELDGGFCEL